MINLRREYKKYADALLKKGVEPSIVGISDIIKLLTEDEDLCEYNFNTDSIEAGPNGELIKINSKKCTVEIYNSIIDNYFTLRVYSLDTGKMFEDGELGKEYNDYYSIVLYGEEEYENILEQVDNSFSDCNREIYKDRVLVNIKMLELTNKLSKSKLIGLKEKILKVAKKYCKNDDYINKGIGKIILNIDDAYKKHSEIKEFYSSELDPDTIDIINRNLYLEGLKRESEAYSKISIFPITEIIEEYKAYNAPKTDRIARKYTFISRKINEALSPFSDYRVDIREHLLSTKDIDNMSEKHRKMLLKRRDELDNTNTWGLHE